LALLKWPTSLRYDQAQFRLCTESRRQAPLPKVDVQGLYDNSLLQAIEAWGFLKKNQSEIAKRKGSVECASRNGFLLVPYFCSH